MPIQCRGYLSYYISPHNKSYIFWHAPSLTFKTSHFYRVAHLSFPSHFYSFDVPSSDAFWSTSDVLWSSYIKILTTPDSGSGYFLQSGEGLFNEVQYVSLFLKKFTNWWDNGWAKARQRWAKARQAPVGSSLPKATIFFLVEMFDLWQKLQTSSNNGVVTGTNMNLSGRIILRLAWLQSNVLRYVPELILRRKKKKKNWGGSLLRTCFYTHSCISVPSTLWMLHVVGYRTMLPNKSILIGIIHDLCSKREWFFLC